MRNKCDFARAVYFFITYLSLFSTFCHRMSPSSPKDISCYDKFTKFLPVIDKNFRRPNNIIYFIESSCNGELRSRYTCSIESAVKANPNWHVAILLTGPLKKEFIKSKIFKMLCSFPNLFFYRIYPKNISKGTPLEKIFSENTLVTSKYPVVHASDLLRVLVLYLFGGLYLDLDIIVLRSFDTLPRNFVAQEYDCNIGSAIIAVDNDEIGRKFANISIRDVAENYDQNTWAANSNKLYRRTLDAICITDYFHYDLEIRTENCRGFHVFSSEWFFPHTNKYYERQFVPMPVNTQTVYTHHFGIVGERDSRSSKIT